VNIFKVEEKDKPVKAIKSEEENDTSISEDSADSIIEDAKQMYLKIIEEANAEAHRIVEAAEAEA
jgi:vacuolar-type H+-ATPase subunit H